MCLDRRLPLVLALLLTLASSLPAHEPSVRREIRFPDLPGYKTLACDFHMHTVFSDGAVWPTVRVAEAWRQGLHAIAITDHVEYQPKKADVQAKYSRSHDVAAGAAEAHGLLLVKACEITREPDQIGHFNALFVSDAAALAVPSFEEAARLANAQGAFFVWNHPGWPKDENCRIGPVQQMLLDKKWAQGIEICNGDSYYPKAHQWCLDKKLTMLGNTDIHDVDLRTRSDPAGHRTMTLVFAKERTLPSLKEALVEGRTAVWYRDQLIGREEYLRPLLDGCLRVAKPHQRTKHDVAFEIQNTSSTDITLAGEKGAPAKIVVPAEATVLVRVGTKQPGKPLSLGFKVTNFLVAPETPLSVKIEIPGE